MAARTKPAPETEAGAETPTEPAAEPASDDFKEKVTAIVEEVLATLTPEAATEPAEPQTAREEEKHTRSVVSQAIEEFLAAAKPQPTSAPETETEPGKTTTRKIEKWLWGKE